jgi:hypothetical protein
MNWEVYILLFYFVFLVFNKQFIIWKI